MVHMLTLMHRRVLAMEVAQHHLEGGGRLPRTGPAAQAGTKARHRITPPQDDVRQARYYARSEGE
jgi:hypothetical protein